MGDRKLSNKKRIVKNKPKIKKGKNMKRKFAYLVITLLLGIFIGSHWHWVTEASAVTNKTYQADTAKSVQNQSAILATQKELLSSLNALQKTVNKLSGELTAIKTVSAENHTGLRKISETVKKSANQQNSAISLLSSNLEKSAEKNNKILEFIYQILTEMQTNEQKAKK